MEDKFKEWEVRERFQNELNWRYTGYTKNPSSCETSAAEKNESIFIKIKSKLPMKLYYKSTGYSQ